MNFEDNCHNFITSSDLMHLAARYSRWIIVQCIARNSGKLDSLFTSAINPLRLPSSAGEPSATTLN